MLLRGRAVVSPEHRTRSVVPPLVRILRTAVPFGLLGAVVMTVGCRGGEIDPASIPASGAGPVETSRQAHGGDRLWAPEQVPERDFPLRVYEPLFPGEHAYDGPTWNENHGEPGESFEAYMSGYRRGTAVRSIHIHPLGKLDRRHADGLELLVEYLEIAFASEVTIRPPLDPPAGSYNTRYGQYDANAILDGMIHSEEVERIEHLNIAVTSRDMYAGQLAFVFGFADYVHHVGVISLSRLGGEKDAELFRRRLLKLGRHEVGHMYGMAHCTNPECVMRGTLSRTEMDATPLNLCPSCAAKLAYRIGDDGRVRNDLLERFYRAHFASYLESRLVGGPLRGH